MNATSDLQRRISSGHRILREGDDQGGIERTLEVAADAHIGADDHDVGALLNGERAIDVHSQVDQGDDRISRGREICNDLKISTNQNVWKLDDRRVGIAEPGAA